MSKRNQKEPIGKLARDEQDMLEITHDMAMDENEQRSVAGRMLKEIMPVLAKAIDAEAERETAPGAFALAASNVATSVFVTMIGSASKAENRGAAVREMIPDLMAHLESAADTCDGKGEGS